MEMSFLHNMDAVFDNIVGQQNNIKNPADMAKYEKGWRYGQGKALRVLRPQDIVQVSRILRFCNKHKIKIVPQGGNTGLVGASIPDDSATQIVLSSELLLNRHMQLNAKKTAVTIGAGVVLEQLNEFLQSYGLNVMIDIGSSGSCHIGGMAATNAAGTRAGKYGNTKQNLLEIVVVLASGKILMLKGGGNIIKYARELGIADIVTEKKKFITATIDQKNNIVQNNSHVDFNNIFCGSSGFFGIVCEATLKVRPLVKQKSSLLFVAKDSSCLNSILQLLQDNYSVSAIEIIAKNALTLACEDLNYGQILNNWQEQDNNKQFAYIVEAEHISDQELTDFITPFFAEGEILDGIFDSNVIWRIRHHITESCAKRGQVIATDIAVPKDVELTEVLDKIASKICQLYPFLLPVFFGHKMINSVHANFLWQKDVNEKFTIEKKQAILDIIYDIVADFGGTYSAEHGIGPHNQARYHLATEKAELAFISALKERLDSNFILNPRVNLGLEK